jgi:small subunit ribosomal protein S3Ae
MAVGECMDGSSPLASPRLASPPLVSPSHARSSSSVAGKTQKKGGGKGKSKKKTVDPFTKKEWYDIKAPSVFTVRNAGKTLITKTQGTKIASEGLKGRVFEFSLGDLNRDEEQGFRKIKLCCEEVQGTNVLTNFHGMDLTRDKLCMLIKKWQSLIEARVDVRTTDGYYLRVFCIGFTKKQDKQVKRTCYAKSAQIRAIRKKMVDIMYEECSKCDLKELVQKFIPHAISGEIEKACQSIFPLQNVYIRKCKVLKKPKFDITKLMEMHQGGEDTGAAVDREPAVETMAGSGGRL